MFASLWKGNTSTAPLVPHPLPHQELGIHHTSSGVVLAPTCNSTPACLISYSLSPKITLLDTWALANSAVSAKCYGVVGILQLFASSHLIVITSKKQVASLFDKSKTVFSVTGVTSIPLTQSSAHQAISDLRVKQKTVSQKTPSSDDDGGSESEVDSDAPRAPTPVVSRSRKNTFTLGRYFFPSIATNSQSNNTSGSPKLEMPDSIVSEVLKDATGEATETTKASLDRKILRETLADLSSGAYSFSQTFDLTRRLQSKLDIMDKYRLQQSKIRKQKKETLRDQSIDILQEPDMVKPLAVRADPRFFYNRNLSRPLFDAEAFNFVTVIQQGFCQESVVELTLPKLSASMSEPLSVSSRNLHTVTPSVSSSTVSTSTSDESIERVKLKMLLISRRSIERPGLRYQRRGIDGDGHVANMVETEFLLGASREDNLHVTSFVQTRGSIPLFWKQSSWSLKPTPVLEGTEAENKAAIRAHFDAQLAEYGDQIIINLAEQGGKEGTVVNAYGDYVKQLDDDRIKYVAFDFHKETKGMQYQKLAALTDDIIADDIARTSALWGTSQNLLSTQAGTFRVNCIDCLDRTNVVQSAIARQALSTYLIHVGIAEAERLPSEPLEKAFNELWANNGDAISREYAGSSALKGDFVRTRVRNWRGQLNDASNSFARLYHNTVADWFKQSCIDYVLGVNLSSFDDFARTLMTEDPRNILRLEQIRSAAVDTCKNMVVHEDEKLLKGWTLLSPVDAGKKQTSRFEEKVVLLTNKAIYSCSYEFSLQKIREFVRIPLGELKGVEHGEYIVSALDDSATSAKDNYGFVIRYALHANSNVTRRATSYSLRNKPDLPPADITVSEKLLAFKVIRKDLIAAAESKTQDQVMGKDCRSQVVDMIALLHQACKDIGVVDEDDSTFVRETPIVSLVEAQRRTGFLARAEHNVKQFIWL